MKNHANMAPCDYEELRRGYVAQRRFILVRDAIASSALPIRQIVEIGAGTGALAAQVAQAFPATRLIATDVAPEMVQYAAACHQGQNLSFSLCDASQSDFLPACDFMYSVDTLHHVQGLPTLLNRARRALSTGGRWLLLEPNVCQPGVLVAQERMRRAGLQENHFLPWRAEPLFRRSGLRIVAKSYRFLYPAHWQRIPVGLAWLERRCEGWPMAGANLVYLLEAV
ncbi:MAG: class I SAM-dependent methyltransferase [Chloroflexota bacterium]